MRRNSSLLTLLMVLLMCSSAAYAQDDDATFECNKCEEIVVYDDYREPIVFRMSYSGFFDDLIYANFLKGAINPTPSNFPGGEPAVELIKLDCEDLEEKHNSLVTVAWIYLTQTANNTGGILKTGNKGGNTWHGKGSKEFVSQMEAWGEQLTAIQEEKGRIASYGKEGKCDWVKDL